MFRDYPSMIVDRSINQEGVLESYNKVVFNFAFGVFNKDNRLIETENVLTYNLYFFDGSSNISIPIKPCLPEELPNIEFYLKNYKKLFCIDSSFLQFKVTNDDESSSNYLLKINKCTSSCIPKLSETLNTLRLKLFYTNNFLNLNDFQKPNQVYTETKSFPLAAGSHFLSELTVVRSNIISDVGWVLNHTSSVSFINTYLTSSFNFPDENELFTLKIQKDRLENRFYRGYSKLQNAIAESLGTTLFVYFFVEALLNIYTRNLYFSNLYEDNCINKRGKDNKLDRLNKEGLADFENLSKTKMKLKLNEITFTDAKTLRNGFEATKLSDRSARELKEEDKQRVGVVLDGMVDLKNVSISKKEFDLVVKKLTDPQVILNLHIEIKMLRCILMDFQENSVFDLILKNKMTSSALLKCHFSSSEAVNMGENMLKKVENGESQSKIYSKLAAYFGKLVK